MNLRVEVERLVSASYGFQELSERLHSARSKILAGEGQRDAFGFLANAAGIGDKHDKFISQLADSVNGGVREAEKFHETLRAIAKHYGATDAEIRDQFRRAERDLEERVG